MQRLVRTALALLVCVGALSVAAPASADLSKMERRLAARINDARDNRDLRRLKVGLRLSSAAHDWSRHLLRADSFHHARLRAGVGEVLAWGTCSWFSPRQAVRAWLRSSSHRYLMLRPGFRVLGTGWTRGRWRSYSCVEMAVARFRY